MITLAIETSSEKFGVAVLDDERPLASYEVLGGRPHASELATATKRVMQSAGLRLDQLDGVTVDLGPGSFTGLRIGVAFAKALLFRLRKPIVGVSSLEVLASALPWAPAHICPILDAKQRKVYAAVYRADGLRVTREGDYWLAPIDEIIQRLGPDPVVVLGDAVPLYEERLRQGLGERLTIAPPAWWLPQVAVLGRLGATRLRAGDPDDPSRIVPLYLHAMDCGVRLSPRAPGAPRKAVT